MAGKVKLTEAQERELRKAADNHFGQTRRPASGNGLVQAGWRRKVRSLVSLGLLEQNAHGDYDITPAGRAHLSSSGKTD